MPNSIESVSTKKSGALQAPTSFGAGPLFPHESPEKQREAVLGFLDDVVYLACPFPGQQEFAIQARARAETEVLEIESLLRLAIAAVDYCVLDEIRPDNDNRVLLERNYSWADEAAIYHRFFCYRCWFPPTVCQRVAAAITEELVHLVIGLPEQISRGYDGVGQTGRLTPELMFWANSAGRTAPPISVSRQELFLELLRCGINPLSSRGDSRKWVRREDKPPVHLRKCRRLAELHSSVTTERALSFGERTASHWHRLLSDGERMESHGVLLFSNGTAANEAAIEAVRAAADLPAFVHPYWYFENKGSIARCFHGLLAASCSVAHVVFLNLEPATIHACLEDGEALPPTRVILDLIERALKLPSAIFVLVVDVTMDPLFRVATSLNGKYPQNLVVVKTISVTKHQHGCRNYFFGAAALFGGREMCGRIRARMEQLRSAVGGKMTESHLVHFPRPTASWINATRSRLAEINRGLVRALPGRSNWRIVPQTYQSFLIPPEEPLVEIMDYLKERRAFYGDAEFEVRFRFMRGLNRVLSASLIGKGHCEKYPGIESGNSFGLSTTRILYDQSSITAGARRLGMGTVRISPGFEADPVKLEAYVSEMSVRFARAMRQVAPLVGCQRYLEMIYSEEQQELK